MPRATDAVLDRVIHRGVKISQPGVALYYLRLLNPPRPRIVISQKIDKRATVRNRLRRRIRAILQSVPLANRAIVVITRKELAALAYPELKAVFTRLLAQIK